MGIHGTRVRFPCKEQHREASMIHPFLIPSEWLVRGRFMDPEGGHSTTSGVAVVRAIPRFPEVLHVSVELSEIARHGTAPSQASSYHLELVGDRRLRFRMDSDVLGTILLGEGTFSERSIILSYQSPNRIYSGYESFIAVSQNEIVTCGCFLADGITVNTWEVSLEAIGVPPVRL
jgi:hypothetical protein